MWGLCATKFVILPILVYFLENDMQTSPPPSSKSSQYPKRCTMLRYFYLERLNFFRRKFCIPQNVLKRMQENVQQNRSKKNCSSNIFVLGGIHPSKPPVIVQGFAPRPWMRWDCILSQLLLGNCWLTTLNQIRNNLQVPTQS